MGIKQSIYTPSAVQIVLLCVHTSRGLFRVPFLPHPPPLSDGNLYPAALLRMRGSYFRPYLSIFACAIGMQQNNENPTTIFDAQYQSIFLHLKPPSLKGLAYLKSGHTKAKRKHNKIINAAYPTQSYIFPVLQYYKRLDNLTVERVEQKY